MPLESGTYIQDLDASNPLGSDDKSQGDDHLRLIKSLVKATFPNASKAFRFPSSGAVKTANFSVSFPTDQNVLFVVDSTSGAIAVTLPDPTVGGTANEDGFCFWITMVAGANPITVTPSGVQTINGAANYVLNVVKQQAFFFWAKTAAKWYALDANLAALAYAQTIALSGATPLTLRRTENNNTTEYEVVSQQLGSGAGAKVSRRLFGGGANDVAQIRDYLGATEIIRWTTSLVLLNILTGVGANFRVDPNGFVDLTEIAAPANPASDVVRVYAKDDAAVSRLAFRDSAGTETMLLPIPARAYAEYTANADLVTAIPIDDTIPQSTEGTEIVTATITLKRANSRVRVTFTGQVVGASGSPTHAAAALFRDSGTDALSAAFVIARFNTPGELQHTLSLTYEEAPGTVGPFTYKIRVGGDNTIRLNGVSTARVFGGASKAALVVEEIFI